MEFCKKNFFLIIIFTFQINISCNSSLNKTCPGNKADLSSFIINDKLYIIGGDENLGENSKMEIWSLNLSYYFWEKEQFPTGNFFPNRKAYCGVFNKTNNAIYIYGGYSNKYEDEFYWNIIRYTPNKLERENITYKRLEPRAFHTLNKINNDTILLFGGKKDYKHYFNEVWIFNISIGIWKFIITYGPERCCHSTVNAGKKIEFFFK